MTSYPLFSIIIPTYNRADRLKIALLSLCNQTIKNFEVIVADDGSTDNTREIVESFKNQLSLKYIWEENWGGPARPRNLGIKLAKGDWICFLDSDDFWFPEKLKTCLSYLENSDFIYHHFDIVTNNMTIKHGEFLCRKVSTVNTYIDLLNHWNGIANSGVVVRKSILNEVGFFHEDRSLIGIEDFDMWLRISRITNRFILIPKSLGGYFMGETNFSTDLETSIERDFNLLEKYRTEISSRQYLKTVSVINFTGGMRYLVNNEKKAANKYFFKVLSQNGTTHVKIKALSCILLGKYPLLLSGFVKKMMSG
jgi:glycosyltransferase involved in cell wall biosynthesis